MYLSGWIFDCIMASGRGFVMAKFYEASAYRNTPRLSTSSLDEVTWAIFCGYFVPLQAALSSDLHHRCRLGWMDPGPQSWGLIIFITIFMFFKLCLPPPPPPSLPVYHNTLHAWVRACTKHLKARGTCLKILGMELHSEHLHSRLPAQKRNWIGPPRSGLPIAFFGLLSLDTFISPAKLPPRQRFPPANVKPVLCPIRRSFWF